MAKNRESVDRACRAFMIAGVGTNKKPVGIVLLHPLQCSERRDGNMWSDDIQAHLQAVARHLKLQT